MSLSLLLFPFMDKFPSLSPTWLAELDFLPAYFSPQESCSPIWKLDSNRNLQEWKRECSMNYDKNQMVHIFVICIDMSYFILVFPSGSDTLYFQDQNVINIYNENFNRHSLVCNKTSFYSLRSTESFFLQNSMESIEF